jgi:uncharacterized SAM-binding protein YcdF (DUF218 family)
MEPQRPLPLGRYATRTAGVLAVLWAVTLLAVILTGLRDEAQRADAIVVMGAAQYRGRPSPVLRARLDHAITLWNQGLASRVILTGGTNEGDTASEAAVSRAYLSGRGVPDSALLMETEGRSTSQSMRGVATLMRGRRLQDALFVSDPYHLLRVQVLARRNGMRAFTSPTPIGAGRMLRRWPEAMTESFKVPIAFLAEW